jgi:hypothetical protein
MARSLCSLGAIDIGKSQAVSTHKSFAMAMAETNEVEGKGQKGGGTENKGGR